MIRNRKFIFICKIRETFVRVVTLTFLLGVTWMTGFLFFSESIVFAFVFTIANGLQGVVIFIDRCLLNRKIRTSVTANLKRFPTYLVLYIFPLFFLLNVYTQINVFIVLSMVNAIEIQRIDGNLLPNGLNTDSHLLYGLHELILGNYIRDKVLHIYLSLTEKSHTNPTLI